MLNGSVTAIAEGAAFRCARNGADDLETTVTGLFGVLDSVHTSAHSGCDLGLWDGTPVPTLQDGRVSFISTPESPWGLVFGNSAIVVHGDGTRALYAHLQEVSVAVGDLVATGDILGLSGHTGYYNGTAVDPHLHVGYATDDNPWFSKDADGGVSRLLDPLANLSGVVVAAGAVAIAEAAERAALEPAVPDAYTLAAHQAAYLAESNDRVRRMLEQRVPKFVIDEEIATGRRLQEALEASVANLT